MTRLNIVLRKTKETFIKISFLQLFFYSNVYNCYYIPHILTCLPQRIYYSQPVLLNKVPTERLKKRKGIFRKTTMSPLSVDIICPIIYFRDRKGEMRKVYMKRKFVINIWKIYDTRDPGHLFILCQGHRFSLYRWY